MPWELLLPAAASLLGSVAARMTGLGFALIAAPVYVVVFGPRDAVAAIIVIGGLNGLVVLWSLRAHVQWTRALLILVGGILGAVPGAWVLANTPQRALELSISALLIVSLFAANMFPIGRTTDTRMVRLTAGVLWGFFTTSSAMGSPPLAVYSRLTDWRPPSFSASVQPIFVASAPVFLTANFFTGGSWFPHIPPSTAAAMIIAIALGVAIGTFGARRTSARTAMRLQYGFAIAGALYTGVRALLLWEI
ncbi:sulfite exporter TauE/SafE family protein [Paenarthrobacter nitroguajacolicus]|uniref:sulfite exporter TauE/SafE family protein n=1 Tax=Paenarthrobacter nitroguajacolicus TaxID=211146 RepID=UPI00248C4FFC|nr:sulfite exporter TauE/SafE family protein [Paenarthrobacter nitroguajacolicus]MDI2035893.1 hypothetical protein [Paenarthrobacter nitroguajacolicus]